jgi:hypothetical protein
LEPAADGLSCVALSDQIGVAQVQVTVDADLGPGVRTLTALLDIEVVAAEAISLGVIAGVPELK